MDSYSTFFSETAQSPVSPAWTRILITDSNNFRAFRALISIDSLNIIFIKEAETSSKLYLVRQGVKMQPVYEEKNLEKRSLIQINLHSDHQQLTFKTEPAEAIAQLYSNMKHLISHFGFNEYFKPIRRLGKGAFATVYLVQHKKTKQQFAAKVFSRQGQKLQFKGKEALENEIKMLRMLNHPNIIRQEGIFETDNLIYLVTQYLSGGTLEECMRSKNKLKGELISSILKDILSALSYLQQRNIMHRDIKPENILLRAEDDRWVLADFGLAACSQDKSLFTKCGTMGYMAPEIFSPQDSQNSHNPEVSSACDLYSLGIIAYELMVGSLPFKVESQGIFQKKLVWNGFSKEQYQNLDKGLSSFLKGLLESNPSNRFTPEEALSSPFFTNQQIKEHWIELCQNRIEERLRKILMMANYC